MYLAKLPFAPGPTTITVTIFSACLVLIAGLFWQSRSALPPDFRSLPAGEPRKSAFIAYLQPIVQAENTKRLLLRTRLEQLPSGSLNTYDAHWLDELASQYEIRTNQPLSQLIAALLESIDTIPVSLALAQAAKESGWGTSRFAVEGNNYFGERCWEEGCGLVPRAQASRQGESGFEVRRFDSVAESVSSYIRNINTHPDYFSLREYRAAQRDRNQPTAGSELAEMLGPYSERREDYVNEIRSMIESNQLEMPE